MQKSCGLVHRRTGNLQRPAGKNCYANTFLNKHLAFDGPKWEALGGPCLNCASVFALSIERKSSNSSPGAKQLCRVYLRRASPCLLEQRQLPEPGEPLPAWPQEAVREPRRAAAPARCRPEMLSKHKTRAVSIVPQQLIGETAAGSVCVPPAPFRWIASE